jgi:5-methylcytosine-specific restriction protein B
MPLPPVSANHITAAMLRFDNNLRSSPQWLTWETNQAHRFAIKKDQKLYPVKQIIAMATGVDVSSFSGGDEANGYLRSRGFEIVPLHPTTGDETHVGMNARSLDRRLQEELKVALDQGLASGELMAPHQVAEHMMRFRDRFGPEALGAVDGEPLLQLMHGRQDANSKCLAYWLEFKNDEEFAGSSFGGIGGGNATKFGVYQRQSDGAWMGGTGSQPQVLTTEDAIRKARQQRDELLAGDEILRDLSASDTSDEVYARLQSAMEARAPELSRDGWSHKYWFLNHPDKLDDYHSPRYQRFHLFKMLQMPPDQIGIMDASAPRFNCAGRFIAASQALGVPVSILNRVLVQRSGAFHRYWRVGTTAGDTGESQWAVMRDGSFVSIGWHEQVPDLSPFIGQEKVSTRDRIREWLLPSYQSNPPVATRKAGEILKFAEDMAENDLVLACEGQRVLAIGRVSGPYSYDGTLEFPHKRSVEWLLLEPWHMPAQEGLQTTVYELGRKAHNLLEIERRLLNRGGTTSDSKKRSGTTSPTPLPPLDPVAVRIDNILRRKGQVVLYGPPGTGKTYRATTVARDLAARQVFHKSFSDLNETERSQIIGPKGLVRLCTFHPSYSYEDFIEGLRPETIDGRMVFERRNGRFTELCQDAEGNNRSPYFLVIDEINRGDIPRIFGELITVLEQDKRDMPITLPSGRRFVVPRNVFLIGTMNTADRSISLLDTALRRRFGFIELMPDSSLLAARMVGSLLLGPWLDALNARLRKHLKRDARNLQIGHAYLLTQPITSVADFARILRDEIVPLLEEYCYDDFGALREILGADLVDAEGARIREELFEANREDDLIQALSFEEMQSLTLAHGIAATEDTTEESEPTVDEAEDASESAA